MKAKAQIEVYKEIYKIDDKTKPALKLTEDLKEEDKEKINNYFKENSGESKLDELSNEQLKE